MGGGTATHSQGAVDPLGIWSEVTLYRDSWGTPHVYAQNYRAMAFGFGYAQAEDHIEALLLAYRIAQGRAAEVWGEAYADSDAFSIRLGHSRLAQQALDSADSLTRDLCDGFALGVNAWLADNAGEVPDWVDGVRPQDVLALWHAYITGFAPLDLPDTYRRKPPAHSGNSWAVAPSKTDAGRTLLVINGHEYYDGPFRWYEAHLAVGDYDVAGATVFGLPVILQGHNAVLGWGLTPNEADTADVFEEQIDAPVPQRRPNDPRVSPPQPNFDAPMLLYYSHTQAYRVRTAAGFETRYAPSFVHSRGPVFEHNGGLFSWTLGGYWAFGGFVQLVEMGRARDLAGFQRALAFQQLPCFHVVYGDRGGNIYYLYNAVTGTRVLPEGIVRFSSEEEARGVNWRAPQPANRALFAWDAPIPVAALPQIANPASGFVQATANPPWLATEGAPIDPAAVPYWLVGETDSFRARRVRQMLAMGRRTFSDMQAMLYDTLMPAAVDFAPRLVAAADNRDGLDRVHPDLPVAINLLRNWGFVADADSPAATFYHTWWRTLRAQTSAAFPRDADFYDALLAGGDRIESAMIEAAATAVRTLRNDFREVNIPWGEVHRIRRGSREEPMFGGTSGDPVVRSNDTNYRNGRWVSDYGYGFGMVVEFGEHPRAASIVPFGASENPQSPHFDDQLDLFLGKRLKRTRYRVEEVLRHAANARGRAVTLYPRGVPGAWYFTGSAPVTATVDTALDGPGELPEGMIAFSLFMTAKAAPLQAVADRRVEVYVPASQCSDNNLPALAIAQYRPGRGWQPLQEQQLDFHARIFTARVPEDGVFALIGPEEALKALPDDAPMLVAEAAPTPERTTEAPGTLTLEAPAETTETEDSGLEVVEAASPPPLQPAGDELPPGIHFGPGLETARATPDPPADPAPTPAPAPEQPQEETFPPGIHFGPGADPRTAAEAPQPAPPAQATQEARPATPAPAAPPAASGTQVPQLRDLTPVGKQETRVFTFRPGEGLQEHKDE